MEGVGKCVEVWGGKERSRERCWGCGKVLGEVWVSRKVCKDMGGAVGRGMGVWKDVEKCVGV